MTRPNARTSTDETSHAVGTRRGAEVSSECARENLMATEPDSFGNQSHVPVACQKLASGALEPQAQHVLLRRLAEELAKVSVEMECRLSGLIG
jgi:hypothetical protein